MALLELLQSGGEDSPELNIMHLSFTRQRRVKLILTGKTYFRGAGQLSHTISAEFPEEAALRRQTLWIFPLAGQHTVGYSKHTVC